MSGAELVICVGDRGQFRDGDVMQCFPYDGKRIVEASRITHPRIARRYRNGNVCEDTSCRAYFQRTRSSAFRRLDAKHVGEVPLRDQSGRPLDDVQGETVHKVDHLDQRLSVIQRPPNGRVFGRESFDWFGRLEVYDRPTMDAVWSDIEAIDGVTWGEFAYKNPAPQQFSQQLWIRILDVDEDTARDIVAPVYGPVDPETGEPSILESRACFVRWRDLPGMTPGRERRVSNPADVTDWRFDLPEYDVKTICESKSAA